MQWFFADIPEEDWFVHHYVETSRKLSDGSIARMAAKAQMIKGKTSYIWFMEIEIRRKRKRQTLWTGEMTGKTGLEGAGFFLEALSDFEASIAAPGDQILAQGADSRRHVVYSRVLGRRGYRECMYDGVRSMLKDI